MIWYTILYIVLALIIYLSLSSMSFTINGKKILSFPVKLLIALILPLILVGLFVFIFTIFVVAVVVLFVLGIIFMLISGKKKGIKRAKVVKVK